MSEFNFLAEPMDAEEVFVHLCPSCMGRVAELSMKKHRERVAAEARKRPYLDPKTMKVTHPEVDGGS